MINTTANAAQAASARRRSCRSKPTAVLNPRTPTSTSPTANTMVTASFGQSAGIAAMM